MVRTGDDNFVNLERLSLEREGRAEEGASAAFCRAIRVSGFGTWTSTFSFPCGERDAGDDSMGGPSPSPPPLPPPARCTLRRRRLGSGSSGTGSGGIELCRVARRDAAGAGTVAAVFLAAAEGPGPPLGRFRLRWPGMCACEMASTCGRVLPLLCCCTPVENGGELQSKCGTYLTNPCRGSRGIWGIEYAKTFLLG